MFDKSVYIVYFKIRRAWFKKKPKNENEKCYPKRNPRRTPIAKLKGSVFAEQ